MPEIISTIQSTSSEFKDNQAFHQKLVDELNAHLSTAAQGGGKKALDLHQSREKLFVRDRIKHLLDTDSSFLELSPLAAHNLYEGAIASAGIVAGIGKVSGRVFRLGLHRR